MSEITQNTDGLADPGPGKRRRLPLLTGVVGAVLLGSGSFYAVYSGLVLSGQPERGAPAAIDMDFGYIPLENIMISLPPGTGAQLLRFSGQIEVAASSHADMARMHPRFLDLVNTYLRAVEPQGLSEPAALIRLRAQILRRLQIIAGDGHIRDFLITEFVLN